MHLFVLHILKLCDRNMCANLIESPSSAWQTLSVHEKFSLLPEKLFLYPLCRYHVEGKKNQILSFKSAIAASSARASAEVEFSCDACPVGEKQACTSDVITVKVECKLNFTQSIAQSYTAIHDLHHTFF